MTDLSTSPERNLTFVAVCIVEAYVANNHLPASPAYPI
ncbi:hypothetical protein AEGHOMDF_0805 [Methylobacterium soli]|nr:hypothetical protein AEGHOMDF_0805 [Methylobacterium soli]